ncbi:MAG: hypothetical protein IT359_17245 [Gemmatimonadaceae bacterium]|nr:hypothetical protein [Gemmatimonadaceae bacterium]
MTRRILLALAAASAAVVLSASTAHAQHGLVKTNRSQRVVATYQFGAPRYALAVPVKVTVSDSAGTLVARARVHGEATERPLDVSVIENDLVLQGETAHGVLTLVLERQATGTEGKLTSGRWAVGDAEGTLRARKCE